MNCSWHQLSRLTCLLVAFVLAIPTQAAEQFTGEELVLREFLVLPRVGRYGRVPIHVDQVQSRLAQGDWQAPQVGDAVTTHDGQSVSWSQAQAKDDGWLEDAALRGGYAFTQVNSPRQQVVLLEASGHAMVFVNGEPRAGDPYLTGRTVLPILLKQGENELLFHAAAGKLKVKLSKPLQDVFFDIRDVTLPTLVRGETEPVWLGVLLVNCREQALTNAQVKSQIAGTGELTAQLDTVPPLGVRKVAIPLVPQWDQAELAPGSVSVELAISVENMAAAKPTTLDFRVVESTRRQTRTFRSALDGSVQAYELLPTREGETENGMLVSLHDKGETAAQQLDSREAEQGGNLLAPSGRRAEGCDWEDWSGRDVLESLDDVAKHVKFDPRKVWLRGTGTGGHGVLRLGGIAADRWAALVPRDPWLEYPAEEQPDVDTPIEEMLERVSWSNRLTPLLRNTVTSGILLEEDQPNPGTQELVQLFKAFHLDFESRAVSGDSSEQAWKELLRFCEKRASPKRAEVTEADCVTFNPGVNATSQWLTILAQTEQGLLSRAAVKFDPERKLFLGLTVNVKALSIDVSHLESDTVVEVALDSEAIGEFAVDGNPLTFLRSEAGWQLVPTLPRAFKRPERYGGLRSAFENRAILVYGTRGTLAENAWALAKARYDAETMLVRLNGSVDVVADTAFDADAERDRNVVLYGNADTNAAWPRLLSTSPLQVRGEGVWIDRRPELGDDLACVFVLPRRGSQNAVVGVVGGKGINGMRATDRLPYFVSGTNFPDLLLFGAKSLSEGNADVRAGGYFGIGWTVEPGEIVWRDAAL
ncbi:MAG: hypothetical protein SH868_16015 [Bythopirellula sp.]|nr:hypothetical protein [Bythopirellula sp.]